MGHPLERALVGQARHCLGRHSERGRLTLLVITQPPRRAVTSGYSHCILPVSAPASRASSQSARSSAASGRVATAAGDAQSREPGTYFRTALGSRSPHLGPGRFQLWITAPDPPRPVERRHTTRWVRGLYCRDKLRNNGSRLTQTGGSRTGPTRMSAPTPGSSAHSTPGHSHQVTPSPGASSGEAITAEEVSLLAAACLPSRYLRIRGSRGRARPAKQLCGSVAAGG